MTEVAIVHVLAFVGRTASRSECGAWRHVGKTDQPLMVSSHLNNLVTCPECRRKCGDFKHYPKGENR
jgi:hypothetical protein